MVEKRVPNVGSDYFTRQAKEIKTINHKIRFGHTRKCYELVQNENCKITAEIKVTKAQQELYFQIAEEEREKNERYMKRIKKKKKKEQLIEGQI